MGWGGLNQKLYFCADSVQHLLLLSAGTEETWQKNSIWHHVHGELIKGYKLSKCKGLFTLTFPFE